jgi:hypothetical protein
MPVATGKHQRQEHGDEKKTGFRTSPFHKDPLSATTNH